VRKAEQKTRKEEENGLQGVRCITQGFFPFFCKTGIIDW